MILVDYSQILIMNLMGIARSIPVGSITEEDVRKAVISALLRTKHALSPSYGHMVLCCDRNSWRRDYFPHYKYRRRNSPDSQGIHATITRLSLGEIEQELESSLGWTVVAVPGAEGDDVLAQLAIEADRTANNGTFFDANKDNWFSERSVIVSSDKDFGQLSNIVELFDPKTHTFSHPDPIESLNELILHGDTSDGIPSILCADDHFIDPHPARHPLSKKLINSFGPVLSEESVSEVRPDLRANFIRNKTLIDLRCCPDDLAKQIVNQLREKMTHQSEYHDVFGYLTKWNMLGIAADWH